MSIPVELDALEATTSEYSFAYLLTVTDDERTKIVAVHPSWEDSRLVVATGGGTARNASVRSQVTLAYPPVESDGYTLIIDGLARVVDADDGGSVVTIAPGGAVLHRAAAPGFVNTSTGCSHDCAPVD